MFQVGADLYMWTSCTVAGPAEAASVDSFFNALYWSGGVNPRWTWESTACVAMASASLSRRTIRAALQHPAGRGRSGAGAWRGGAGTELSAAGGEIVLRNLRVCTRGLLIRAVHR